MQRAVVCIFFLFNCSEVVAKGYKVIAPNDPTWDSIGFTCSLLGSEPIFFLGVKDYSL